MSKKITSFLLVLTMLVLSISTVFAAPVTDGSTTVVDDGAGAVVLIENKADDIVTATFKLKGAITLNSAVYVISYDATKVAPYNASAGTTLTGSKLSGEASITPYMEKLANTELTGYSMAPYIIDSAAATKYLAIGYAKTTGADITLSSGTELALFKVNFKKVNSSVVIDETTFNYYKTSGMPSYLSKLVYNAVNVLQTGTSGTVKPEAFTISLPTPSEYKVTFDLNYDSAPAATQVNTVNGKVSAPEDPTRTSYTFGGWYEDAGCTTAYDFDTVLTADKILYAKWTENAPVTHTVTFKAEGNTVATKTVNHGSDLTDIPAVPEKVGYTGVWDTTNFTNITVDMTVNAVYTIKTYTITFKAEGNTVATKTVNHGANLTDIPAVPSKPGYTGAWDTTNFANITADMTVNAVYTEIPAGAAITLTNNASGSVKVGNKFNVPVTVTGIDSFRAIAFTMSYDTAKLKYKGYVAHENFSTQVVDPAEVAAVNGTAVFAFGASDGDELTGSTVVATLEFEALAATDSTEISLSNVIYAVIPTSDDVNISNITNTTVSIIDNTAPVISGLKITGVPAVGQELTAEYTYSDADNNAESGTTFAWYSADTVDGTYTLISGANTNKLTLTEDLLNKYIKVVVTPNDGITFGIDYSAFTADKVTSIIPGDVHQDGKVQLGDALLVMDYLEGKTILTDSQKIAADISGDGQILAEDVVKILLKAAKAK